MATLQDSPNLYERLGGVYSIATVVDDLIDRVMADPRLNANPLVDDAHHKVPPAGFKYLVTEMLCWAAGGPQKYTGKDMESLHRHLRQTRNDQRFTPDLTWISLLARRRSMPSCIVALTFRHARTARMRWERVAFLKAPKTGAGRDNLVVSAGVLRSVSVNPKNSAM